MGDHTSEDHRGTGESDEGVFRCGLSVLKGWIRSGSFSEGECGLRGMRSEREGECLWPARPHCELQMLIEIDPRNVDSALAAPCLHDVQP
jgi:hypothetical protein